jgi:hypothetical protein
VAILGGGAAAAIWAMSGPAPDTPRVVELEIDGLDAGVPVSLTLAGHTPSAVEGRRFRFDAVAPGTVDVRAGIGAGCSGSSQDPAWCGRYDGTLDVAPGADTLVRPLALAMPGPRDLLLRARGPAPTDVLHARLDGGSPVEGGADGLTIPGLRPGRHAAIAWVGSCGDADAGCSAGGAAGTCPPGCASWSGDIVVPAGTGARTFVVSLPVADAAASAAPPVPAAAPRGAGKIGPTHAVTVAEFARWLGTHPEWQADAARGARKADANYLSGWDGASPPAGGGGQAMVNVSWSAAAAFCAGRGGLAPVDAAPLKWSEGGAQPRHELRDAAGRPGWRRSDGVTSVSVQRSDSLAVIGFRCAR